jgi:hypothetical protein
MKIVLDFFLVLFRGKYFLLVVSIFYGVLFFFKSHTAQLALLKSSSVLIKILPILMFVILFTAVLNFFYSQNKLRAILIGKVGSRLDIRKPYTKFY